eukprot:1194578-Prorocentrum_minimum.AAC.6
MFRFSRIARRIRRSRAMRVEDETAPCRLDLGFSLNGVIINEMDVRAVDTLGTVEVSPASRLCVQECEMLAALYKAVKLLRKREKDAIAVSGSPPLAVKY